MIIYTKTPREIAFKTGGWSRKTRQYFYKQVAPTVRLYTFWLRRSPVVIET